MTKPAILEQTPVVQELSRREPKKYNSFLYLKPEEAYKIKIDDFKNLGNSFFSEIYRAAIKSTADIIQLSDENIGKTREAEKKNKNLSILNKAQEYNNIIAFCGERGTGKSSAMLSFTQALLNINEVKFTKETGKEIEDKKLQQAISSTENHTYHTIDIIDPSLFEENDNIFEVIIAQLFSSFERELEKNDIKKDINDKRKVLGLFEKVYENLKSIKDNGNNYDGEALETLNKLACGANLKNNFKDLVNQYLRFICGEDKKTILVIGIDDFDLNVNAAVEMAEQIRKYLMIPQVIVLLAVNIDQLEDVKEQSVRKDFKIMIKARQLKEKPKDITSRYLLKLIPSERRLSLPKIDTNTKATCLRILPTDTIENIENLKKQLVEDIDNENLRWKAKDKNIEEYVLSLVYNKTGLIFTSKENKTHFLVPTNLRKLTELVHFLVSLDCSDSKNISYSLFRNYLYTNYISDFFSNREMKLLYKLIEAPSFEKNKFIITEIKNLLIDNYLQKYKSNKEPENSSLFNIKENIILQEIVNSENNTVNISLRDVLYFLDKLQHTNFYSNKERFIDAVKVIYSIELYKYLIIDKNGSATRELCGESVIPSFGSSYVPKKRENSELRNDLQLNLQSIRVGDIDLRKTILKFKEKQEVQLFTLCLPHFGADYMDRRKENEPFLKKEIVINNNLLNQKQAHYDLFSFITSEIDLRSHFIRFSENYSKEELIIYNKIHNHLLKYNCSLPIYSLDLMGDLFEKSFSSSIFSNPAPETLFSSQVAILNEIKKRINSINLGYIDNNILEKAFVGSPLVNAFIEDDSSFNALFDSISNSSSVRLISNEIDDSVVKFEEFFRVLNDKIIKLPENANYRSIRELTNKMLVETKEQIDMSYFIDKLDFNSRYQMKKHRDEILLTLKDEKFRNINSVKKKISTNHKEPTEDKEMEDSKSRSEKGEATQQTEDSKYTREQPEEPLQNKDPQDMSEEQEEHQQTEDSQKESDQSIEPKDE